jgi:hypothetical protein
VLHDAPGDRETAGGAMNAAGSASHPLAQGFLIAAATIFFLGYALPLFVVPLAWAKWFRWKLPAEPALTIYFGRCLGAVGIVGVIRRIQPWTENVETALYLATTIASIWVRSTLG